MTFGPNAYIPVLKVKRGEKRALAQVAPAIRARIVPLLEVVERQPDKSTLSSHLDTAFGGLAEGVEGYTRFMLDTRELESEGSAAAANVFDRAASVGLKFTPVTGVTRTHDVAATLQYEARGVALRLTRAEFEQGDLPIRLEQFLVEHGLDPSAVDLIVDLGAADDMVAEGIANLTSAFLAVVPAWPSWRTFSIVGCAFPLNLAKISAHTHAVVERAEWKAWRDYLHAHRSELDRLPTFGDHAIQHVKGVEGFDPRLHAVSAAVRYALPADWLLIKGQSTRVRPPSDQFPVLARRLVSGDLKAHFRGGGHCAGCLDIALAAQGAPKLGSAEAWRRLGTIHHLTVAAEQIAALTWP